MQQFLAFIHKESKRCKAKLPYFDGDGPYKVIQLEDQKVLNASTWAEGFDCKLMFDTFVPKIAYNSSITLQI